MKPAISFIVPAFNEEGHLQFTVEQTRRVLKSEVDDFEIMIINDGSTDKTVDIAEALAKSDSRIRVFHNDRNRGFGFTCRRGVKEATKEFVGWVSADTVWPEETLREAIALLGKADIVTTYPLNQRERPVLRRFISSTFTALMNSLFFLKVKYYNGGCFYRAALVKNLEIHSQGLTFWAEALVRSLSKGYRMIEIGMRNIDRTTGKSKAFKWKNILATLKMIINLAYDVHIRRQKNLPFPSPSPMARVESQ